ncbi:nuclease-related domain-containing protein [Pseudarthrobacter enclensis]|uniref:nuclease-related domain-containing protein n=1 Tax=Pseudarthrobacter enclensis TaxID=993070 RepID=UPI003593BADD
MDHLIIGPSGVYCINTKSSTYGVAAKADGTVLAATYLSAAARINIACTPVVAVWSSLSFESERRRVVDGLEIADRLRSRPSRFPDAWVYVVYATARRSTPGRPTTKPAAKAVGGRPIKGAVFGGVSKSKLRHKSDTQFNLRTVPIRGCIGEG